MTTKKQSTSLTPLTLGSFIHCTLPSKLEERKGNVIRTSSLKPNRSLKKNLSLKPLELKSR